jgi:hypothetical protein
MQSFGFGQASEAWMLTEWGPDRIDTKQWGREGIPAGEREQGLELIQPGLVIPDHHVDVGEIPYPEWAVEGVTSDRE